VRSQKAKEEVSGTQWLRSETYLDERSWSRAWYEEEREGRREEHRHGDVVRSTVEKVWITQVTDSIMFAQGENALYCRYLCLANPFIRDPFACHYVGEDFQFALEEGFPLSVSTTSARHQIVNWKVELRR